MHRNAALSPRERFDNFWNRCGRVFIVTLALNGVLFPLAAVWWLVAERSPQTIDACPVRTQ